MSAFYSLSAKLPKGGQLNFETLKGKVVLIVNVASKCGKTPRYAALEALYKKYQPKLEIVGFPSNQFKAQEPGTDEEIAEFCTLNYGVTFPLAAKSDVNGPETNPVYKYLKEQKSVENIEWNFDVFLIDKEGNVAEYFGRQAGTDELEPAIQKLL